jgi:hypothetical protein
MTEAELIESSAMYNGLMYDWLTMYFTAFTAFIVTAHFVGGKLTRDQVVFVTGGFLMLSALSTIGVLGTGSNAAMFAEEIVNINPNRTFYARYSIVYLTVSLLSFGILGSLKFMWDARHPKTK